MKAIVLIIGAVAVLAASKQQAPSPAPLRVLGAIGMKQVIVALADQIERATTRKLSIHYDSGALIAQRIVAGERADVVLIPRAAIEQLAKAGLIAVGPIDLATSRTGVAVRAGAPKPDISSSAAFRTALLQAKSIAYPDPALGGSSGMHLQRVFEKLAIADMLKPKVLLASTPGDESTLPGALVAAGTAEIALHQLQELMAVRGIDIVGPLPQELQETFVFSGAILRDAADAVGAKRLLDFLVTNESAAAIRRIGMEAMFSTPR